MDRLAKKLAKGYFTLEELGVKLKDVRRLRDKGYRVFQVRRDGKMTYSILSESENVSVFLSGASADEKEFRWAECSDIHAGSKQFDEPGFREFLARCEGDGYKTIFIAGD